MGICWFYLIGKKDEIEKLGRICDRIGAFLRAKYKVEGKEFIDWTGISYFIIFQEPNERTLSRYIIGDEETEKTEAADWIGCEPWEKDQAAIWWGEIAWPFKIPSEVWQVLREEGKRLKIQNLVEEMVKHLSGIEDCCMDAVTKELGGDGKDLKYSRSLF